MLLTTIVASTFPGLSSGSKDAYNFYHSQLRIRIECAFGRLTQRWGILRSAIPLNIKVKRTISLVIALVKLHNFCVDFSDSEVPSVGASDDLRLIAHGVVPLVVNQDGAGIPEALLGGGHHMEDVGPAERRERLRDIQVQAAQTILPRERMLSEVADANLTRPRLMGSS